MTSDWQADCTTDFLGDPPPRFISHDFRKEHGTWLSLLQTEEVKDVNTPFSTTFASPVTNIKELLILKGTLLN